MLFIIFVIFFNRFLYRSLLAVDEEGHREDTVKFANELFDKLDTDRSNDISIDELSQAIRGDQELALEVRNKLGLPKEIEERDCGNIPRSGALLNRLLLLAIVCLLRRSPSYSLPRYSPLQHITN